MLFSHIMAKLCTIEAMMNHILVWEWSLQLQIKIMLKWYQEYMHELQKMLNTIFLFWRKKLESSILNWIKTWYSSIWFQQRCDLQSPMTFFDFKYHALHNWNVDAKKCQTSFWSVSSLCLFGSPCNKKGYWELFQLDLLWCQS